MTTTAILGSGADAVRVRLALLATALGLITMIPGLPVVVRVFGLSAFVLLGPGLATMTWLGGLERYAQVALIPLIGVSLIILLTTAAAFAKWWHPSLVVVIAAAITSAVAIWGSARTKRTAATAS